MSFKSKKGKIYFTVLLAILFLSVILPLAFNISYKKETRFTKYIGESQILLLRTYEKGEKIMYYIDQSTKLALREAIFSLAQKGGLSSVDCGTYDGYNKWNSGSKNCYPEQIEENLIQEFKKKLNLYFTKYPEEEIPPINYEISLKSENDKTELIAKALQSLRVDITEAREYNFQPDSIEDFSVQTEEGGDTFPIGGTGSCQDLVQTAISLVNKGCRYAEIGVPEDPDCESGLSCVQFNNAALLHTSNHPEFRRIYAHGKAYCNSGDVVPVSGKENLNPGDFFSSLFPGEGGQLYGHTGMYVGRGRISDPTVFWSTRPDICFTKFTPDSNGEMIFAHSVGWVSGGNSVGRACFVTYDSLFRSGLYYDEYFCRHKGCV